MKVQLSQHSSFEEAEEVETKCIIIRSGGDSFIISEDGFTDGFFVNSLGGRHLLIKPHTSSCVRVNLEEKPNTRGENG